MFLGWSANLFSAWMTNSIHTKLWDAIAHTYPNFHDGVSESQHYSDAIMGTIASQITSLTVAYSIVYSDADQRKHQSSASLAFVWGIHRDRWIPRTKGKLRGKCFHLMTSSWISVEAWILKHISRNALTCKNYPCPNDFRASRLFSLRTT